MSLKTVLLLVSVKICPCKIHHKIPDKPEHETVLIASDKR